jgi:hypothetical protein
MLPLERQDIPVFYLHSGDHSFCNRPGCVCMKNNTQLEAFLREIIGGRLKLRQIAHGAIEWRGNNGSTTKFS